jgi:hypothetical protein
MLWMPRLAYIALCVPCMSSSAPTSKFQKKFKNTNLFQGAIECGVILSRGCESLMREGDASKH